MKRLIAVFLCIIMVAFCFCSCMKGEQVKSVEDKISSITEISLETDAVISEIEEAYSLLPDADKSKVGNYGALGKIKENYEFLEKFNEDAQALLGVYEKIFTEYGISVDEVKPFAELEERYNSCDESVKAACGEIFDKIFAENDKYVEVEQIAVPSAATYVRGFLAQNPDKKITISDIGCIAQISEGITYFMFALTYTDNEVADKNVYSVTRFTGTPSDETTAKYASDLYRDAPSFEKTDALLCRNIDIDLQAVLDAVAE